MSFGKNSSNSSSDFVPFPGLYFRITDDQIGDIMDESVLSPLFVVVPYGKMRAVSIPLGSLRSCWGYEAE
eukprot:scaffold1325_cov138-Amphora_coffeaeformis.AAC.5